VIELDSGRKVKQCKDLAVPPIVRLLDQAVEFQAQLAARKVRFRVQLAAANGLSAMRVTNILGLLKLAPTILAYIRSLPAGAPPRLLTERALRPLTGLPHSAQVKEARRNLPGFARFVTTRPGAAS